MEVAEALAALDLGPGATWSEVRARYRLLLRANHPDLSDAPGAADRTARLTAAFAVLQKATGDGRRALPHPERSHPLRGARPGRGPRPPAAAGGAGPARRSGPEPGDGRTGSVVGGRAPEEVFQRLRAAAGAVGNVSGVDPETLTLQILIEAPGAAPAQLLAEVSRRGADTAVAFTLESLTAAPGPPIEAVVERLLAAL
ncbi:MAG: J domain-containing protein [bacterium]|nr:J domain-containing protein [bacterium]MCY3925603.1 J domain-containing protein [bacterium]